MIKETTITEKELYKRIERNEKVSTLILKMFEKGHISVDSYFQKIQECSNALMHLCLLKIVFDFSKEQTETESTETETKETFVTLISLYSSTTKKVKLLRVLKKSIEVERMNLNGVSYKEKFYNRKDSPTTYFNYDGSIIINLD